MRNAAFAIVFCLAAGAAFAQAEKPLTRKNPAEAGKVLTQAQSQSESFTTEQKKIITFYERELMEAEKKHNWEAIDRRVAPDFLEIGADGKAYTKQQVAAVFKDVTVNSYNISEIEFRSLSSSAALLAYRVDVDASFKGQHMPGSFRVSSAWSRVGGAWMVRFHQVTIIPK